MPEDKQVHIRYQVLNKCLRDPFKEYTIDDLVDVCNAVLRKADRQEVSKRTIQNDIAQLQLDPYYVRLDESLFRGKKRIYRYYDMDYTLPQFQMDDEERFKIQAALNVCKDNDFFEISNLF